MAQKTINLGTAELAGDGETLRSAFSKANDNFTELYAGGGGGGGLSDIVDDTTPQLGGTLDANGNTIDMGANIITDAKVGQWDTSYGWGNHANAGYLTSETFTSLVQDTTPQLGGNLDLNNNNITGAGDILINTNKFTVASATGNTAIAGTLNVDGTLNGHTIPGGTGTLALTSDITSASTAADDLTAGDAAVSIETTTGNITIDAQGNDTDIIFKGTDDGVDRTFLTMKGSTSTIEVDPDANFKLVSGADPNKGVKFATSGSAHTTVTFGSASGTVVIHSANQTLTNKTIDVDNNTVSNIEVDNLKSGVLDTDLSSVSGSDDTLASAKAIKAYVDANAGISNVVEDTSPQLGGDLDAQAFDITTTGKILFANMYATEGDLPSATTYHGMFAHVHATGAGYFAHGGQWVRLANHADLGGGGSGTGDISFSASDILTDAKTMNFKVDANNDDSGYEGYYFYGGPTNNGNVRIWVNGTGETAIKMATSSSYTAMLQKSNEFKFIGNEHSGNHPVKFYNNGNGNAAHIDLGLRHADARVRITDINASVYYVLPSATPNLGDVLTASDASGTLAWSAPSGGSSNAISQGNSNVTVTDTGSDGTITFDTEGTDRWQFTSDGHLLPYANASYDIGSADYKVRHLFLSDNSLKFVDSSDTVHELSVANGFLQFKSKDVILSESTQNVNMNVNGAGLGISIGTASTSGTTISIGAEVNNTSVNMYGVTEFGARAIFNRGVHEKFLTITGATGVVDHNTMNGHVFYHTGAAANFTANFTNLSLAQEDATNIAIIINQGNTGYIPSAVQIGGAAQTIVWNGNSTPSATDNGTDVFSFTILNDGGTYVVLGQMVSFGGV